MVIINANANGHEATFNFNNGNGVGEDNITEILKYVNGVGEDTEEVKSFKQLKLKKEQERSIGNGESKKSLPHVHAQYQHPIQLKKLDHYTLICKSSKQISDHHCNILGFTLDKIQPINSGTAPEGEIDMLNYILHPPANKDMVMVVTEGLNDRTVFRKYMKSFGEGVHHLAFEVDDVDSAFAYIKEAGVQTTSERVTTDMLSGLKQFFILPCHAGFFIELIERPKNVSGGEEDEGNVHNRHDESAQRFSDGNMAELAQSIGAFVEDDSSPLGKVSEGEEDTSTQAQGYSDYRFAVGSVAAAEICIQDIAKAADFLTRVLRFRMIRNTGDKIHLCLRGSSSDVANDVSIFLVQANAIKEERQVTMMFNASAVMAESRPDFIEYKRDGLNGRMLSEQYFSYKVVLLSSVPYFPVVTPYEENGLAVDIQAEMKTVVDYLANPSNLPNWTGHKAIHFSKQRTSWVESRKGPEGQLVDYNLHISVEEDANVIFSWPDLDVKVMFRCTEKAPGCTMVCVTLPPSITPERRLAKMKRIVALELDILKAIFEGNALEFISDRHYCHIQDYHLSLYGADLAPILPENVSDEFGFRGEILRSGSLLEKMSTDFALTITSRPEAVLRPSNLEDVAAAVKIANELHIPLAARGSQVSHSAGGQAQANNGILVDMSCLSSVDFIDNDSAVKCGPGTFWDEVIRQTLRKGLMPPVINDYQYLSVGGTISMGGIGFVSHQYGLQAAYVKEMDVITGRGDIVTCTSDINKDLFDCCRGGLGQVGIIGSVTIPLVAAPTHISICKLFYKDIHAFVEDVQFFVNGGKVDMIHAFLKPSTSVPKIVGGKQFEASSADFQSAIKLCESRGDLVLFLELGRYTSSPEANNNKSFMMPPQTRHISGEMFHEVQSFQSYIKKDPPVVETNNSHGSVPHPSFATFIDEAHVEQLLQHHIQSDIRGNDDMNEILIMPVKSNSTIKKGQRVPLCPLPDNSGLSFFLLFLGSVIDDSTQKVMTELRAHHRSLYQLSLELGGKRYSYDTVTSEVAADAWKEHFGADVWMELRAAKRAYDPNHILCPGIKMWG